MRVRWVVRQTRLGTSWRQVPDDGVRALSYVRAQETTVVSVTADREAAERVGVGDAGPGAGGCSTWNVWGGGGAVCGTSHAPCRMVRGCGRVCSVQGASIRAQTPCDKKRHSQRVFGHRRHKTCQLFSTVYPQAKPLRTKDLYRRNH